ncbi:MAG: DUF1080 domain-containing protein [Planctomycetaceae bacterium]
MSVCRVSALAILLSLSAASAEEDFKPESGFRMLFDGSSFDGWDGDQTVFRTEQHSIVGGRLKEKIPHNFFLAHSDTFADFDLRLQFKLIGDATNAGIQIRSERIPDHHEMIGYQADLGQSYWGCLYDESRRRKVLAGPDAEQLGQVLKKGDWNDYRILCEGPRIRLYINDLLTVDYTESEQDIPLKGKIAVQIHGGPAGEAWYRHIRIQELGK